MTLWPNLANQGYGTRRRQSDPSETCLAELELPPATTPSSSTPVKEVKGGATIECNFSFVLIQRVFDVAMAFAKEPVVATEDQRKRLAEARATTKRAYFYTNATTSGRMATGRDRYTPLGMPQEPHQRALIRICYVCHNPGNIATIFMGSSSQVS